MTTNANTRRATISLLTRNLDTIGGSSGRSFTADDLRFINASNYSFQHWAAVIRYFGSNGSMSMMYEANDEGGYLVARSLPCDEDTETEWMKSPGAKKVDLWTEKNDLKLDMNHASNFCTIITNKKGKYVLTENNCQVFVKNLVAELTAFDGEIKTKILENLPKDAEKHLNDAKKETQKSIFASVGSASLKSLSSGSLGEVTRCLIMKICNVGKGTLSNAVIKSFDLCSTGAVELLKSDVFKQYMKETGSQVVLSTTGEIVENLMTAARGAFTPWNFLQIPAEVLVKGLMTYGGFSESESYWGGKVASFGTALTVGGVTAGPVGIVGSVAFYIAAEFASLIFWNLLGLIWPTMKEDILSFLGVKEDDLHKLAKTIYKIMMAEFDTGARKVTDFMMDYIQQQCQKKMD